MNEKIAILIPSCGVNFDKAFKVCLESIDGSASVKPEHHKILAVMNGMKDKEKFETFINAMITKGLPVEYLWYDQPLGYVGAINAGMNHIMSGGEKPDYVVFLNDDVGIYSRWWLDLLLSPFEKDEQMGLVGAKSLPCPITGIDFPLGWCVMTKMEVFEKIGVLDTVWGVGFNDDADFCIRAMQAGYHIYSYVNGYDKIQKASVGNFPASHTAENTMHSGELFSMGDWDKHTAKNRMLLAQRYWETVHVICPVYQRYEKLKVALESLHNQYYTNIMVHVVSDGKDDKVKEIVEQKKMEWAQKPFQPEIEYTFIDPPERGYGGLPRKTVLDSLENNDNEWVIFVDSDNVIQPDYVLKLWQSTFLKPECGMTICQINHIEENRIMPMKHEIEWGQIDSLNVMVRLSLAKKHAAKWIHNKNRTKV